MSGVRSLSRWRWALSACSIASVNLTYFERLESRTGFKSYMPLDSVAAVHEDIDRRVRLLGAVDVEPLDFARPIGDALRHADRGAGALAVENAALGDLLAIGRVDDLIVGVVELLLVHVEPHARTFCPRRLRQRRAARGHRGTAGRSG